jgi:hypothetical protein
MDKTLEPGDRVHYKDYPELTGTVVRTERAVKSPRRGSGFNTGNTNGRAVITMYVVTWDDKPHEEDRNYASQLIKI